MGTGLEIRHLEMLRAIARHGRVSDAAVALGLTPSAFSHRIREAERRLGVALFTRLNKRLRMTPVAEYLLTAAERILTDLERTEADVIRMGAGMRHIVRLATEAYTAYHWLPHFLTWLEGRDGDVDLQVMADARRDPVAALKDRRIDIAIIEKRPRIDGVELFDLFDDELVYIMPPRHEHAGKQFVEAEDLVDESYITYELTPRPDREFAELMRPAGVYPRWNVPVELPEAIVELVAAGQGTSTLARWAVEGAVRSGRVATARVTRRGVQVSWCAAVRTDDSGSDTIGKLASALRDWCRADALGFCRYSA